MNKIICRMAGAALLFAALPTAVVAQGGPFVEARGGVVFPAGDLNDFEQTGAEFGGGFGLQIAPRLAVRFDVDAAFMDGEELDSGVEAPGINHLYYIGGVDIRLLGGASSPFALSANAGAGGTRFEVEAFGVPQDRSQAGQTFVVQEHYITLNGGLRGSYRLGRVLSMVLSGQAYRVFGDEDDTAGLELLSDDAARLGDTWTFPATLGLRVDF